MRHGPLRNDLSMLLQGISVGAWFGLGSLEELARVGLELEQGVYRAGSMVATADGVRFELSNPPLRVGAFGAVIVHWDGVPLDPRAGCVATARRPEPRPLDAVTAEDPLSLAVGETSRFELRVPGAPVGGRHRVRIEWTSVAIPPTVWLEFDDDVRRPREGE